MKLVRYQPKFFSEMIALHRSAKVGFVINISEFEEETDLRSIERIYLNNGGEFLVGLSNNSIIAMGGFQKLPDASAELRRMRIQKDYQGQGYGGQLLKELECIALNSGIIKFTFETAKARPLTLKFYRKLGHIETGEGFYNGVETIHFQILLLK